VSVVESNFWFQEEDESGKKNPRGKVMDLLIFPTTKKKEADKNRQ